MMLQSHVKIVAMLAAKVTLVWSDWLILSMRIAVRGYYAREIARNSKE